MLLSRFPKLDGADAAELASGFPDLDDEGMETVLYAGEGVLERGIRILIIYLSAAPEIYRFLGREQFDDWLYIAKEVSKLSVSCCEGFFDSSLPIIEKGGLGLLHKWAETGITLSEQNKWVAIAYFKYTGQVIVSKGTGSFHTLVEYGSELASINTKVAESYFEHLAHLVSFLSPGDLTLFHDIIKKIIGRHWLTAIELMNLTEKILPLIPQHRKNELLISMHEILEFGELPAMELFRNAGKIMEKTDEEDFTLLMDIAAGLAVTDSKSARILFRTIPQYLEELDLKEVKEWKDMAISFFRDNKTTLRAFIQASLQLGKDRKDTTLKSRSTLIQRGLELAEIQPECLESYFSNAAAAYNLLTNEIFEEWIGTGEGIALQDPVTAADYCSNSIEALNKISPELHGDIFRTANMLMRKEGSLAGAFFGKLSDFTTIAADTGTDNIAKWAEIGARVYEKDRKMGMDYFENSPQVLEKLEMDELEEWALKGLETAGMIRPAGEAYFTLQSRSSREKIDELTGAIALKEVANVLRYYALGLSGNNFVIRSMESLPLQVEAQEMNPVIAGNTIYLAPKMGIYEDVEDNFRIYKLSVMHEVGHARFSSVYISHERADELITRLKRKYPLNGEGTTLQHERENNGSVDLIDILSLFPNPVIAATIFGLLEDARVEHMIMEHYKGVRPDLEEVRRRMFLIRPVPEKGLDEFMESLLWISTGHEPQFEVGDGTERLLGRIRKLMESISMPDSDTISSMELAIDIYSMLEEQLGPLEQKEYRMLKNIGYRGMDVAAAGDTDPMMTKPYENIIKNFIPETEADLSAHEERPKEQATDKPTQSLDKYWRTLGSYRYDEWDSTINDYRSEWSTVNEIEPTGGNTSHYKRTMERYGNEISLLKHAFSLVRPETFQRMKEQYDGTEIDIDAFIEALIARKCGINPEDRSYIRWDKHERDVATLFLMDVSASTRKILGADGRSILDVEKDALIIMSQALESIGDKYAIYAFSGKSRENIEYFVIKEFHERFTDNVARRIGILGPASNTRLGPAIRHSIKKLEDAGARTKMMVLLSDGEPYDRTRGEDSYQGDIAQEDTRVAISEGRGRGMHFFCITVDRDPGNYLDNIFSDVGYTIIDDALILPETLPLLYKRLTT